MTRFNYTCLLIMVLYALTLGCTKIDPPLLLEPLDAQQLGFAPALWVNTIDIQSPNTLTSVEILNGNLVLVESPSNLVSTVSLKNGSPLWSRSVGEKHDRLFAPKLNGKELLVCSETQIHTLSALSGKLLDKSALQLVINTSPLVTDSTAIFGTVENRVYAHNLNAGFSRWQYAMPQRITVAPMKVGSQAMIVIDDSGVYALLGINNGRRIWHGKTFGKVSVNPVIGQRQIYIASQDNALYAIDRVTGSDIWKFRGTTPFLKQHKLLGNMLIVPMQESDIVALNPNDGNEIWRIKLDALPVMKIGKNILFYNKNSMMLVDAQSGKLVRKVHAGPLKTVLVGQRNSLILVSPNGRILRVDPSNIM